MSRTQHTAQSIQQLARGFIQSRILITAAELDIFTLLSKEPLTLEAAARTSQLDLRGLRILLDALTALGFLDKQNEHYQTQSEITHLLSAESDTTILPMVLHAANQWKLWSHLTDRVCGESNTDIQYDDSDEIAQTLVKAMHTVNASKAPAIIQQIQPDNASRLLDIGGGAGTYTQAFLQADPKMRATLFDLPTVTPIAEEQLRSANLSHRVNFITGDYLKDQLPQDYDLALLSAITHQHSPEENGVLYRNVHQALVSGGRIIIRGFVMDADKSNPLNGALFAVNMLAGTPGGRTYSYTETRAGLLDAGFTNVRLLSKTDDLFSLIDAVKL